MSDLRHEAEACRRLWLAVAEKAVVEACAAIVRRSGALDDAVAREMRYFHSKGWREVCEYAGISYRPDHIERFLKSPDVRTTSAQMRLALGLMGDAA